MAARGDQHELRKTTPILRIFDEHKAKEFYIGFLGFTIDWEHRFEEGLLLYMQISKDSCVIHLSEHHGDAALVLRSESRRTSWTHFSAN